MHVSYNYCTSNSHECTGVNGDSLVPRPSHLQFLITCSMQSKTGGREGLGMRLNGEAL